MRLSPFVALTHRIVAAFACVARQILRHRAYVPLAGIFVVDDLQVRCASCVGLFVSFAAQRVFLFRVFLVFCFLIGARSTRVACLYL